MTDDDILAALVGPTPEKGPSDEEVSPKPAAVEEETENTEDELDPEVRAALETEDEEAGGAPGAGANIGVEDLARYAEALGLDVEDLIPVEGRVYVRTKIDGELGQVSLQDLRKGYQKDSSLTRKQQEFIRQQTEWQQAQEQQKQQINEASQVVMHLALQDRDRLVERIKRADLDGLRDSDPAEYAAKIADFTRQDAEIRARYDQAQQYLQRQAQEQQQKVQEWQTKVVQEEHRKLREALKWDSDEKARSGGQAIETYLTGQGFSAQDLAQFVDHRAAVIADKARRYDALMSKVNKAKMQAKAVASNPVRAPGGTTDVGAKVTDLRKLRAAAMATGKVDSMESLAYILGAVKKSAR